MNPQETPPEKLTETIRGRVEHALKQRLKNYEDEVDRSESYVIRQAVNEFLDRKEKGTRKKPAQ